jgi:hypothetical protein
MNYQQLKAMTGDECMDCIRRAELIWFDNEIVWGKKLLEEITDLHRQETGHYGCKRKEHET